MAEKFSVTGDQRDSITGQMLEIQRQLRQKGGSPIHPDDVALALQDIIEGRFIRKQEEKDILRPIFSGKPIIIDACDGKSTLANAKKVFKSDIDLNFENWGTNEPGIATQETAVRVCELIKDATFVQIFSSLGTELDELCLTQHQIISFCENYPDWLCVNGYATLFLFKVSDQYFVVRVHVNSDGLCVNVSRLEHTYVWSGERRHRVVSPQLIPLEA